MKPYFNFLYDLGDSKCIATMAAADCKLHAVALAEQSAEVVLFQRFPPSLLPTPNDDSAALAELPASHFSGKLAQIAHFVHNLHQLFLW